MNATNLLNNIIQFAQAMKCCVKAMFIASQDPRTPKLAKYLITIVIAYALSPIDLIPDFIPVLGYLDDLIVLPLGIYLVVKLIPSNVWNDCILRAQQHRAELGKSRSAAFVIVVLWVLGFAATLVFLTNFFGE